MSDVEQRLREAHPTSTQYALGSNILLEAADRIAELEAENARLREAITVHVELGHEDDCLVFLGECDCGLDKLEAALLGVGDE